MTRARSFNKAGTFRTWSDTRRDTGVENIPWHTLLTTPLGTESTAPEVVNGVDLTGKRAIVTGGSSGLGVETARALASAGAEVTLAVRNTEAGEKAKSDIAATMGNQNLHIVRAVSSVGHIGGNVDFDDIMFDHRPYNEWVAYGQSKTANVLFTVEATKRLAGDGIFANALNPGRIPSKGLMRHIPQVDASTDSTGVSWKDEEQGAATSALLAASPLLDGIGGRSRLVRAR